MLIRMDLKKIVLRCLSCPLVYFVFKRFITANAVLIPRETIALRSTSGSFSKRMLILCQWKDKNKFLKYKVTEFSLDMFTVVLTSIKKCLAVISKHFRPYRKCAIIQEGHYSETLYNERPYGEVWVYYKISRLATLRCKRAISWLVSTGQALFSRIVTYMDGKSGGECSFTLRSHKIGRISWFSLRCKVSLHNCSMKCRSLI